MRTLTLLKTVELALADEATDGIWLIEAEDPAPLDCARIVEEALFARGSVGLTYLRGEIDEDTFVQNVVRLSARPVLIALPGAGLWSLLAAHRSQLVRRAPVMIFIAPPVAMIRDAAHVLSLAGTNLVRAAPADDSSITRANLFREMRLILATFYASAWRIEVLASDASIPHVRLRFETVEVALYDLLREAKALGRLGALHRCVTRDYPDAPGAARFALLAEAARRE